MYCPSCNSSILPTDARCLNCRAVLIESSEKKSSEFIKGAHFVDSRIYYWVGGIAGFLIALGLFFDEHDRLLTAIPICVGIGGLLGKFIARKKWLS